MSDLMKPLIYAASEGPLSRTQAEQAFELLFNGDATMSQIGGFLMAMRARGESVAEYAAAAAVMRAKCISVSAPDTAMDIVGTGGDGVGTLNISTATAFVVAGAGVPVAKHGNRNLSSKSGAADALGKMGVNVMVGADTNADLGFIFRRTISGGSIGNISDSNGSGASGANCSIVTGMNQDSTNAAHYCGWHVDDPSTTSQITYGLRAYPNGSRTMYINRRGADASYTGRSRLVCIEIGDI